MLTIVMPMHGIARKGIAMFGLTPRETIPFGMMEVMY